LKNQIYLTEEIYWTFSKLQFELIYFQENTVKVQQAFNELYEFFLDNLSFQTKEINISEVVSFLILIGLKFNFEKISYEIFSSIIFLCSGLPSLHEQIANVLRILVNLLNIQDRLLLKNDFNDTLSQQSPNSNIYQKIEESN
jgi:hypothetical protein